MLSDCFHRLSSSAASASKKKEAAAAAAAAAASAAAAADGPKKKAKTSSSSSSANPSRKPKEDPEVVQHARCAERISPFRQLERLQSAAKKAEVWVLLAAVVCWACARSMVCCPEVTFILG
jgi:hypothetical protein